MQLWPRLSSFWRNLFRKERVERELSEEVAAYLDLLIEAKLDQGIEPAAARRQALIEIGGVEQVKESVREVRMGHYLETLSQDLRFAVRVMAKQPVFTLVAVLTLSLGVGATTAIFSVVNAVLIRRLPISDPERVVTIHNQLPKLNLPRTSVSALHYIDYSNQPDVFESTAALGQRSFNLTGVEAPLRLQAGRVTASFLPMLGVTPLVGRAFTDEEDRFGNQHVALLSHNLWKRLFNADAGAIGQTLQLDGEGYQVIGVLPASFAELYPYIDLWIPMAFSPRELSEERRWSLAYSMLARLKPGVTLSQAQAAMSSLSQSKKGPNTDDSNIEVRSLVEEQIGDVRQPLYILLAAVGVVLLIACANIANLLLARASVRSREMAIRAALGAGRRRIIRQLLTESVLLGISGGVLGVLFAAWGMSALVAMAPADLPRVGEARLDARVLVFTLVVSLASGIIFGLMPALVASKTDLVSSLKESGRSDTASPSRHRLRRTLVVAEVSLAVVLLIGAGLLLRSFAKLLNVSPGFDPHNVLTLRWSLPRTQYGDAPQVARFANAVLERVTATPGVEHAAVAFQPPFMGNDNSMFSIRDRQAGPDAPPPHADYLYVTWDYFRTMGIPLIKGRLFESSDMRIQNPIGDGSAVIIDEALAKRFWPDRDPIGANLGWGSQGPWATIVGVVGTAHPKDLIQQPEGTIYFPWYLGSSALVVRTTDDPHRLVQTIREQVQAVDANLPVYDVKTMDERLARSLEARRFAVTLLGVFAALALLLAAIGLYGVIAYLVTQRSHEIGIRVALGASRADVLRLVLGQALQLALIGIGVGLAAALALTQFMSSLLFGVSPTDPLTFAAICIILTAVALLASYIPARRATRIDPMVALRYE
ncbi:MAG TPA: ABC transporter permease [Blastocatellia bacterium]|nr:ABC transporter permease [Blastocatellia bacterium]